MKTRRVQPRLLAAVGFAVVITVCAAAAAPPPAGDKPDSSDLLYSEEFALESGGRLTVNVDDMDIRIKTDSGGPGGVEVFVSGRNRDKSRERFEKSHFEARLDGNHLVVENREPRSNSFWFGNRTSNYSVLAVIRIPRATVIDVTTEDGDVRIDDLNGDARIYTEDGDLELSEIRGETIDINTEDGDITAGSLAANEITISTEDGDLDIETIEGKRIHVSSSDGDISVSRVEGMEMTVETEDGDVSITRIDGDETTVEAEDGDIELAVSGRRLEIRCEDGDVAVSLLSEMEVDIDIDDGDIELDIPKGADADIDLRGGHVNVRNIAVKGRVSDSSIEGSINNGGAMIRVRASDGSIRIREN
jgi:DUF4097 and DUF4098 domain-containing protein YvlB